MPRRTTRVLFFIASRRREGRSRSCPSTSIRSRWETTFRPTTSSCPAIAWSFLAMRIPSRAATEPDGRACEARWPRSNVALLSTSIVTRRTPIRRPSRLATGREKSVDNGSSLRRVEARLSDVERKLDLILEALKPRKP